jgi:hypothetical protein
MNTGSTPSHAYPLAGFVAEGKNDMEVEGALVKTAGGA